jgi:hypothetical protein
MNKVSDKGRNIYRIYEACRGRTFFEILLKNVSDNIIVSLNNYSYRKLFNSS